MAGWFDVLVEGITTVAPALANIYLSKESQEHEREMARIASGTGGGLGLQELMFIMGLAGGQQPQAPAIPGYQFGGAPAGAVPPGWIPIPSGVGQVPPLGSGGSVVGAPYQTVPYTPAAAPGTGLIPGIGQALGGYLMGGGSGTGGGIVNVPQVFQQNPTGMRAKSFFATPNPVTGNLTWYRNVGRPILFSGDLTACKRVNKVAARARRASPRRRAAPKRRR